MNGSHDNTCICIAESEKNKHAEDIMIKILNDAVWMNIHGLPVRIFLLLINMMEC